MLGHIDARAPKRDAFHFKPHALFKRAIAAGFELSACAEHAIPGQGCAPFAQYRRHLPVPARIPGSFRHLSVGRDLTPRNQRDCFPNG